MGESHSSTVRILGLDSGEKLVLKIPFGRMKMLREMRILYHNHNLMHSHFMELVLQRLHGESPVAEFDVLTIIILTPPIKAGNADAMRLPPRWGKVEMGVML